MHSALCYSLLAHGLLFIELFSPVSHFFNAKNAMVEIKAKNAVNKGTSLKEVLKMSSRNIITFQEALDIVESLPESQQEDLIDLIRRRLIEQKRQKIAKGIREARKEYAKGEVKKGSVDDLMKELSK
jgi:hypothetical protein